MRLPEVKICRVVMKAFLHCRIGVDAKQKNWGVPSSEKEDSDLVVYHLISLCIEGLSILNISLLFHHKNCLNISDLGDKSSTNDVCEAIV